MASGHGGHGGKRTGAGRPRKSADEHFVTGDAGKRGRVLEHPSSVPVEPVPLPALDEADAPNELTHEERQIWLELAPHAMANGTLTDATKAAFVAFIRWESLSRQLAMSVLERGTSKHINAHKEALKGYYDFALRPTGKAMPGAVQPQKAANPLSEFLKMA